ncbi:MAG: glycosyltransferase family 4 protein, partial [Microthrixaceae bacterium]
HEVRMITDGSDHDTIDLEDRVWVHRLVKPGALSEPPPSPLEDTPLRIWANASRVDDEVRRLAEDHRVDLVYAAVWDTEALAVQHHHSAPVVVALVTSLALALESSPSWAEDPGFMAEFAAPMLRTERMFIAEADGVHAISETILGEIERSSDLSLPADRVRIEALGTVDPGPPGSLANGSPPEGDSGGANVLFVGRFEKRKGIDLLLEALLRVMVGHEEVTAILVGRNDLPAPGGTTWSDWMDRTLGHGGWRDRIEMRGEVSDEELHDLYRGADLFVAPSRFESFGLIYVEAMAHGLPVIALDAGAATEVLDGTCAILADASPDSLGDAIVQLIDDPALRDTLGAAGRSRFESRYTTDSMIDRVGGMLDDFAATFAGSEGE